MSPEQRRIWISIFGQNVVRHLDGCLQCVKDVKAPPSKAELERAGAALSDCQTRACLRGEPGPLRCAPERA